MLAQVIYHMVVRTSWKIHLPSSIFWLKQFHPWVESELVNRLHGRDNHVSKNNTHTCHGIYSICKCTGTYECGAEMKPTFCCPWRKVSSEHLLLSLITPHWSIFVSLYLSFFLIRVLWVLWLAVGFMLCATAMSVCVYGLDESTQVSCRRRKTQSCHASRSSCEHFSCHVCCLVYCMLRQKRLHDGTCCALAEDAFCDFNESVQLTCGWVYSVKHNNLDEH